MKICLTLFALTIVTVCDGALIEGLLTTALDINTKVHNVASSIFSSIAENIRPKQDRPYQNTNGNPNGNQNLNIYDKGDDMQFNNNQQQQRPYSNPNSQYRNPNNQQASHSNQPGNQNPFNNLPAYSTEHPRQNTPNNAEKILEDIANMHNKNPVNDNAVNKLKDTISGNDRPLFVPIKNPVYSGYEPDVNGPKRETKDKSTPKPADEDEDLPIDIRFINNA